MASLQDLLTKRNLREFAGGSIYSRGLSYYQAGRAKVNFADEQEAECVVRGTSYYTVSLWVHDGNDLGATCTCPYAMNGWFCKHAVAAGLAVSAHLERSGGNLWKQRLDFLLQGVQKMNRGRSRQPYWLFLTMMQTSTGWQLAPQHLWADQVPEGVLPANPNEIAAMLPDLVSHNNWLMGYIKPGQKNYQSEGCLNGSLDEIGFANLLLQQNRQTEYYYYDYYNRNRAQFGSLLPVVARTNLPLFLGDTVNPVRRHLQILPDPVEIGLQFERNESGIRLQLVSTQGHPIFEAGQARAELLTSEPVPWLLAGDQIFHIQSDIDIEYLQPWLRNPIIGIPPQQEEQFLEEYFPTLAEQFPIEGPEIQWEEIRAEPIKRLYLLEEEEELQIHLRFGYGPAEVLYDKKLPETTVRRQPESWTLFRVYRQPEFEEQAWGEVSSAHHGLKRSGSEYGDHVFLLRSHVHPIDFLMRHVPRLLEAGFEIYGEEKLKSARVNRNQPSLSLNVSSGIDWFDLQAVVKFGDVEAALGDVRRALKRKERYIKLADGTIGEIPEEWLERYKHLFGLGEETDDGLRFSNHHLTMLDQLLGEADRVQYDPEFQRRKKRLLDFEGIQTRELPRGFEGELRPYQKAGFDWLYFLHDFEFGGCLADDMGLGK
ncbi:MAG TPA: hypothetical protein DEH25_05295, partial [Chloroflexi bacterium]|nr:hypothetical protein [Chloroflexota bacterium]